MSNSYFYFYPGETASGTTPLQTIDTGRRAAAVDRQGSAVEFAAESLDGRLVAHHVHTNRIVTIEIAGIPTGAVQRQLVALVSHARKRGVFGFSVDHAKFFAAFRSEGDVLPAGSDLGGVVFPFPRWHYWQTSGLGSGDIVAVESMSGTAEEHEVSSVSLRTEVGASLVLDGNLAFRYRDVLVREKYSWPALTLVDPTAPILTSVGDHTWALQMQCRVAVEAIAGLRRTLPGTSGTPGNTIGTPYAPTGGL